MVPKNEVWSRKVSETKAHRAGRVPESVARGKRSLARIGMPEYLPEDNAGQIRRYNKQTAP